MFVSAVWSQISVIFFQKDCVEIREAARALYFVINVIVMDPAAPFM